MAAVGDARKRQAERAAAELTCDVDTLAAAIRRNAGHWLDDYRSRALAEALVAAGFGDVAAARREVAEAEQRGREDNADHSMCYIHGSAALDALIAEAESQALYDARDALYRGEGPDAYADADIQYGEWLGNRGDQIGTS